MVFPDVEHNTYAVCVSHLAIAGFYLQGQVIAYIKSFKVCINGCINHIQAPESNKKQHGIINILPYLVSEGFNPIGLQP